VTQGIGSQQPLLHDSSTLQSEFVIQGEAQVFIPNGAYPVIGADFWFCSCGVEAELAGCSSTSYSGICCSAGK